MCGEIDEQVLIGQEMLDRARDMTKAMNLPNPDGARQAPEGLAEPQGRAAYMENIFRSGLSRALQDIELSEDDEKIDALASQAIAFARLAGFLAGQLPPEADLYRAIIEAASDGHAEPRHMAEAAAHHHHHHHHHH